MDNVADLMVGKVGNHLMPEYLSSNNIQMVWSGPELAKRVST